MNYKFLAPFIGPRVNDKNWLDIADVYKDMQDLQHKYTTDYTPPVAHPINCTVYPNFGKSRPHYNLIKVIELCPKCAKKGRGKCKECKSALAVECVNDLDKRGKERERHIYKIDIDLYDGTKFVKRTLKIEGKHFHNELGKHYDSTSRFTHRVNPKYPEKVNIDCGGVKLVNLDKCWADGSRKYHLRFTFNFDAHNFKNIFSAIKDRIIGGRSVRFISLDAGIREAETYAIWETVPHVPFYRPNNLYVFHQGFYYKKICNFKNPDEFIWIKLLNCGNLKDNCKKGDKMLIDSRRIMV